MSNFLGFDTSNYMTSAAIYFSNGEIKHAKKLLPVKHGEKGLRQNDAVFHHVAQMPEVFTKVIENLSEMPAAVGVSARPRDQVGSYMPCFSVGTSFGKAVASLLKVPCFEFSHQAGHIVATLFSAKRLDLLSQKFLAFHVSGGTTEALLVEPDGKNIIKMRLIAKTLDLNAGQLIDRVGVALGLNFPAGPALEELALNCSENFKIIPTLKGFDCCLSGVENLCAKMQNERQNDEKIARFCVEYIAETLKKMCEELLGNLGDIPVLFAGGVMSNSIIRKRLKSQFDAVFGSSEFSSDNAVGISVLAAIKVGDLQ